MQTDMQTDLTRLSDPEFMAEAEALRDELGRQGDRTNLGDLKKRYDDLRVRYEALAAEFDRRVAAVRGA